MQEDLVELPDCQTHYTSTLIKVFALKSTNKNVGNGYSELKTPPDCKLYDNIQPNLDACI